MLQQFVFGTAQVQDAQCPTNRKYHMMPSLPPLPQQLEMAASWVRTEKNSSKKKTSLPANKSQPEELGSLAAP